jgi:hypothetical protein
MMLRSLVDEVVRRRLWPIPVVAILIAVAAPVLFMKSAPDAPADTAQPPAAAPGKLPSGAERLVSTSDKAVTPRDKAKRKGKDPFAPPSSGAAKADDSAAAPPVTQAPPVSSAASGVVIQNSDGSTSTMPSATTSKAKKTATTKSTAKKTTTTKKSTAPKVTTPEPSTTSSASVPEETTTYVDVRFGKRMNSMIRYRVPRLQTFRAGGKVAAMFVHYSATRDLAVFAVAPSTLVAGDVECRTIKGVCRYVDIAAGQYARLTLRGADGRYISRRLDVVSIRQISGAAHTMPRVTTVSTANCLLQGLLKLPASLPSISFDACD